MDDIYQIENRWTMNKGVFLVKGHANAITPGNTITVRSERPGRDGSCLSLVTIGRVEDIGTDPYHGEPMRLGWPTRN